MAEDDTGVRAPPERSVDRRFIGLYTLAQVGAFIAFVPMLNLLLPLKAESLDPAGKAVLLSQVAVWGALAAAVANLFAGTLSDATRSRWGRRRPWIAGGALAVCAAHFLVLGATDAVTLTLAILAFQVAVNLLFGPLNAVLADRVPDRQKGLVSAWQGLALPTAGLFSALVLALLLDSLQARVAAAALAVPLFVAPLVLWASHRPETAPTARPGFSLVALRDADFRLAFVSRLLVQVSITLNVLYLLFYVQDVARLPSGPLADEDRAMGWLMAAATVSALVVGFLGGVLSDRTGRRRRLIMAGGLMMAGGAVAMAAAPAWPGPLVAQVVFGAGLGLYSTVDIALVAQVLPDRRHAGRDLGVMNLAITAPQVAAPMIGLAVLAAWSDEVRWIFAVSAVFAALGGLVVLGIRRVG